MKSNKIILALFIIGLLQNLFVNDLICMETKTKLYINKISCKNNTTTKTDEVPDLPWENEKFYKEPGKMAVQFFENTIKKTQNTNLSSNNANASAKNFENTAKTPVPKQNLTKQHQTSDRELFPKFTIFTLRKMLSPSYPCTID